MKNRTPESAGGACSEHRIPARRLAAFSAAAVPLLLGCSLLGRLPAFRDGCYLGTARAWLDENGDGVRQPDERPLAGVAFHLRAGDHEFLQDAYSDERGEFFLSVFPQTCEVLSNDELTLEAVPPAGYQPGTPGRLILPEEEVRDSAMHDYEFGFVRTDAP